MSELIEVTHLTFTYTGQAAPALKDVSLTIHAGEFITLVGRPAVEKQPCLNSSNMSCGRPVSGLVV
ncbi:Duplicated ATPase component CbrU of energizing module of predicted cobalamin ECF transporter [Levilactobacillus brevis]|nr:Duplicated ATPase component CbrU of energizing module of predicted cobalamin ECF transporter [Levilactobacillus brevis]